MGSLYSEHLTWLHRWSAGRKLACMALLGTLLFLLSAPWALALAALACTLLWRSLGLATRVARRLMVSVLAAALLVAVFHLWMGRPDMAAVSALRLACASTLGVALTVSTRPTDLLLVLDALLAPLARLGLQPGRVSLQLALMLRFTEHFFVQWKRLDEAHRLRTGRPGGLRLIAPLTVQMLQRAQRVADALYARLGG
ncbi:CbiQ family ECF transporter T component [Alicycliphilus denitrificans]|uniref:ABC-type transporter, integral membrane subunit n=1 Tax=Alicycliphilus denitrificans (strain DSM 14773 / CIP 107495 / K601) TaxID=596154 RepID=F4G529_ALIDK|nr:CbiQ family ECF transporter T component [Alicycliphilus denitrificans]ADV00370.1 cobalt transport protein [Alicycliphilus denitrificans BC]AEB85302.1 ABC-type transporter, integral membrane subunit [Alicycliphilus denitrificans K601]